MAETDLFAYQDALTRASRDIHARCGTDINLLWDEGRLEINAPSHRLKIWNGLGSIEADLAHEDLIGGGTGYQRFLDGIVSAVKRKLVI
jgi:hypothetical protein